MPDRIESSLIRSLGESYLIGPTYLGSALDQTGQLQFFNGSSRFGTIFQAGNATAEVTYVLPTAGPAANNYLLASSTVGVLSWLNAAGTYAPIGSAFVTIGSDATLTSERSLTGTSNQIVVTDNGAGSTVVLSTPQSIHTAATPTFGGMTLNGNLAMATNKVTGLGAASANGDALRFEQLKFIQVVNNSDATTTGLSTNTWTDTGLSASITPTSASNRILIIVEQNIRVANNNNTVICDLRFDRSGTVIKTVSNVLDTKTTAGGIGFVTASIVFTHIDSPATTSARTYKTQFQNETSTGTVTINPAGSTNSSEITLMEVV